MQTLNHFMSRFIIIPISVLVLSISQARAVDIREITSEKGINAWLVEDYSVPIVTMKFSFNAGSAQDPKGKEGLVNLMSSLLDEGAGELDSKAFQEQLDLKGLELSYGSSIDSFSGTMRVLEADLEEAINLVQLSVNEPRFDQKPLDRIRGQVITSIRSEKSDPNYLAGREWAGRIWDEHPYGSEETGTEESLNTITSVDLKAVREILFAREGLKIGIVGAIKEDTAIAMIDTIFGELQKTTNRVAVADTEPKLDQVFNYAYDLPQTNIQLMFPGVKRDAPEFFNSFMMSHILGGGTFSSRLYKSVREERGLAYGVNAYLAPRDHATGLYISTATGADRAEETVQVIYDEIQKLIQDGVGAEELQSAKNYVKGSYAIRNLANSSAIASTLVGIQEADLGIDYINRRNSYIEGVTAEGIQAAAKALLSAKPAMMILGKDIEKNPFNG